MNKEESITILNNENITRITVPILENIFNSLFFLIFLSPFINCRNFIYSILDFILL